MRRNRRSIRLKGYDYSQEGLYFITICCQDRACLFGEIIQAEMVLNETGNMIVQEWIALSNRFKNINLHEFVVMPNHFHCILEIVGTPLVGSPIQNNTINEQIGNKTKGDPQGIPPTRKTVGDIIGAFKSITSVEYIRGIKTKGWPEFDRRIWQRNYWEHIIRDEKSFSRISEYIKNNPKKWLDDKLARHSKTI